jgi:microcystin-dependent protein
MASPFIGQIQMFGFNFPPRGWSLCDGVLLAISSNTALFSLLGTTFGGDGRTTFGLPDLRGRSATHVGTGPGISTISWGERGGAENVTLSVAQMPSHNHLATTSGLTTAVKASSDDADGTSPAGALLGTTAEDVYSGGTADSTMNAAAAQTQGNVTVDPAGGSQQFGVRDPYLGIYHSIALTGVFPSRN